MTEKNNDLPFVEYYVSYSIKGHCFVWQDEDVEYVKTLSKGDVHTFKERDNTQYFIHTLPEKLIILDIVYDEEKDIYSVYLDHVLEGPAYLSNAGPNYDYKNIEYWAPTSAHGKTALCYETEVLYLPKVGKKIYFRIGRKNVHRRVTKIVYDITRDLYKVFIDHTHHVGKPFDYEHVRQMLSLSFTETTENFVHAYIRKWMDMINISPEESSISDNVIKEFSEKINITPPEPVSVTFNYDHL